MASDTALLKERERITAVLEGAKLIPKLDAQKLYGSGGNFRYVDPPKGYGIPVRQVKSRGRRSTTSKATPG
jgi:hypothetical protein